MGLDLTLLLPIVEIGPDSWFAHSNLWTSRAYDLYEAIRDLPSTPVAADFSTYVGGRTDPDGETCYGNTQVDPYDDPVRCVTAGDLAKLAKHPGRRIGNNRAI